MWISDELRSGYHNRGNAVFLRGAFRINLFDNLFVLIRLSVPKEMKA